ncbi:hypothetical protein CASFOL_027849 [Castilleja foliolosa]|uniref:Uncharacterized protein n=1 Tax=Castilleja foliolosa TaxID=1961234 RepID=A0ABD3CGT2_9LAMI
MSTLDLEPDLNVKLVDWNGRLGALCCTGEKEECFTENGGILRVRWRTICT